MGRDSAQNYFSKDNIRFNIHNLSYLPRWIIILIDFSILLLAFFFTLMIFDGTQLDYIVTPHSFVFVSFLFSVNVFFFWLFRTYAGIIRHSSNIDVVKRLFLEMSVLIVFFIGILLIKVFFDHKAFLNTALFINIVLFFVGCFFTVSS